MTKHMNIWLLHEKIKGILHFIFANHYLSIIIPVYPYRDERETVGNSQQRCFNPTSNPTYVPIYAWQEEFVISYVLEDY